MIRKHRKLSIYAGFSLVEVMVGMVIGLLTVIVIMQVIVVFDAQKRTVSSGADAQENGLISLNTMATDIRMGGYGLITSGMLGCTSINTYYNGTATLGTLIMPVMIADGGAGSDTITGLYSGSGNGGIPATIVTAMPSSSAVLTVNVSNGMNVNDLVLVSTPGTSNPCMRVQITALQTQANGVNVLHNSGLSLYNPAGSLIFPPSGYGTTPASYLFDMGTMVNNRYQILCNTLTVTDLNTQTGAASCTDQNTFANATPLTSNIVSIQAQYGIAPVGTPPANQSVNCWTDAAGIACGATSDWSAPVAVDIARIKAIRIAIVARSALMEKPTTGTTCNASAAAPVTWPGGPAVNLAADPNWNCYRYKVYETIIPLRNVLWANM